LGTPRKEKETASEKEVDDVGIQRRIKKNQYLSHGVRRVGRNPRERGGEEGREKKNRMGLHGQATERRGRRTYSSLTAVQHPPWREPLMGKKVKAFRSRY